MIDHIDEAIRWRAHLVYCYRTLLMDYEPDAPEQPDIFYTAAAAGGHHQFVTFSKRYWQRTLECLSRL